MPSSRRTDEILKSQVSFRGDKDGIEVKLTETTEVEVDVTVAPLDRRLLGPSGPRYRFLFSDDLVLERIDNQGAGERPSAVPAKPLPRAAVLSLAMSPDTRALSVPMRAPRPGRHYRPSGFAISSLGLPAPEGDDCQQPA